MLRYLIVFAPIACLGCSDSAKEPAPQDAGATTASTCVFPAPADASVAQCPANCIPITGRVLDEGSSCVRTVRVGCFGCRSEIGCGGSEEGSCHKYIDGRAMMVADYAVANDPSWTACTADEAAKLGEPQPCP